VNLKMPFWAKSWPGLPCRSKLRLGLDHHTSKSPLTAATAWYRDAMALVFSNPAFFRDASPIPSLTGLARFTRNT